MVLNSDDELVYCGTNDEVWFISGIKTEVMNQ